MAHLSPSVPAAERRRGSGKLCYFLKDYMARWRKFGGRDYAVFDFFVVVVVCLLVCLIDLSVIILSSSFIRNVNFYFLLSRFVWEREFSL